MLHKVIPAIALAGAVGSGVANAEGGRNLLQRGGRGNGGGGGGGGPAGDADFTCPGTLADFFDYTGLKGGEHHWNVINPLKDGISFMTWGPCDSGCAGNKVEDVKSEQVITSLTIDEGECIAAAPLCLFVHDGSFKRPTPLESDSIPETCYSSGNQLRHMCRYELTPQLDVGTACDDGVDCTPSALDKCNPEGVCVGKPDAPAATDFCEAPANLPDTVPICTKQICDPDSKADTLLPNGCDTVLAEKGTVCTDGFDCTTGDDQCDGQGTCVGAEDDDFCSDGKLQPPGDLDECRVRACVATGKDATKKHGGCQVVLAPENAACDDGYGCTVASKCSAGGECQVGTPKHDFCNDEDNLQPPGALNECEVRECVPEQGTKGDDGCKKVNAPEDTLCDDGFGCTDGDKCNASGVCQRGEPQHDFCRTPSKLQPPGNLQECRERKCVPGDGTKKDDGCTVVNAADGASCDDGYSCTTSDTCTSGNCGGTVDHDQCTATQIPGPLGECKERACVPGQDTKDKGGCKLVNAEENTPCEDEFGCTRGDMCNKNGHCESGTKSHDFCSKKLQPSGALAECKERKCVASSANNDGCEFVNAGAGTSCSDGYGCTTGDTCSSDGTCSGTVNHDKCDVLGLPKQVGECEVRKCKPSSGTKNTEGCAKENKNNGMPCSGDGFACSDDTCRNGNCISDTATNFCAQREDDTKCETCVCDPEKTGSKANGCSCQSGLASVAPNIVIGISIDESGSVTSQQYNTQKSEVAKFIREFSQESPNTIFYINVFDSDVRSVVGPKKNNNNDDVANAVSSVGQRGRGTNLQAPIQDLTSKLRGQGCGGSDTFCIGVLITDGQGQTNPTNTDLNNFYNLDGKQGTQLATFAIGSNTDDEELERIANPDALAYGSSNFGGLRTLFNNLAQEVCNKN